LVEKRMKVFSEKPAYSDTCRSNISPLFNINTTPWSTLAPGEMNYYFKKFLPVSNGPLVKYRTRGGLKQFASALWVC
jgi:hypothetical protein